MRIRVFADISSPVIGRGSSSIRSRRQEYLPQGSCGEYVEAVLRIDDFFGAAVGHRGFQIIDRLFYDGFDGNMVRYPTVVDGDEHLGYAMLVPVLFSEHRYAVASERLAANRSVRTTSRLPSSSGGENPLRPDHFFRILRQIPSESKPASIGMSHVRVARVPERHTRTGTLRCRRSHDFVGLRKRHHERIVS